VLIYQPKTLAMGMDTEFKVGDKVIATTPFLGEKKDRDGIVRDVQANRYGVGFSYRVEVVVAGDTTSYWLTADKLNPSNEASNNKPVTERRSHVLERLGWMLYFQYGWKHSDFDWLTLRHMNGEWVMTVALEVVREDKWNPALDFTEWVQGFMPAADVSVLETTEPDWDKCMKAIRYDFDFLGAPPDYRIVGRQKVNGQRSYVVLHPDQPVPFFYPSVTTIIDAVIPKDKALEAWAIKEFRDAKEKAEYMDMKAAYGTVVHGAIADLVNGVLPDFEDYEGWHTYMLMATGRNGHSRYAKAWTQGTQKAVLSVVKWIQDYEVRILAMELPLCHRGNGTAGQIDFLVERNAYVQKKTGQFKEKPPRVIAVDDIKTGNSSDMYVPQLGMYGEIVEHNFPALKGKIEAYGIIVPINWKRDPKCKFTDKTAKVKEYRASRLQMHLDLFRKDMKPPRGVQTLVGKPAIDMNLSEAIGWKPLETVWIDKIKAGDFGSDDDVIVQEEEQEEEDDD